MSNIQDLIQNLIQKLQEVTGNKALPIRFWEGYTKNNTYRFKDVLDKYSAYCSVLNSEQKNIISAIFWKQVEMMGTPIIEAIPGSSDDECAVYFLYPKDELVDGKHVYLQGDYHGYGATDGRQVLTELSDTGIMWRVDNMPKDAIIVYSYIHVEPIYDGIKPVPEGPPFFNQAFEAISSNEVNFTEIPQVPYKDEYSQHISSYPGFGGPECVFRVSDDTSLAHLQVKPVDWPRLLSTEAKSDSGHFKYHATLYSDKEGALHRSNAPVTEKYNDDLFYSSDPTSPYAHFTRDIQVFKPASGQVDNLIVINDGIPYLITGILENFEKMVEEHKLSPNTALVFVHTLPGLKTTLSEEEMKVFNQDPSANLPGMGERLIDYKHGIEQYAVFIENKLLPQLKLNYEINIPDDPSHRIMIGSSLSGTASIYMGLQHSDLFGAVIAQSPSPDNREILSRMPSSKRLETESNIYLSCGKFEHPNYAASNANLEYAKELADKLDIVLHQGAYGHQFIAWNEALEQALPYMLLQKLIQNNHGVGASVAVLDSGDIHTFEAGKLACGEKQHVTPDSVFEAASLSKPVFAYIVLKMVERGEMNLDTPLCHISNKGFGPRELRETPQYQKLTARMILSHQTGLPNWMPEAFQAEPQTQFNYSGLAYCFLCDVIQEISGQSLEQLAKQALERLGIYQSSYFYQPEDVSEEKKRFAVGHNAEGVRDKRSHFPRASEVDAQGHTYPVNPAASLFITAEHYAKFLVACMRDTFIQETMCVSSNNLGGGRDSIGVEAGVSADVLDQLYWGLGVGIQNNSDGSKTLFHWGDCETFRNLATVRLETDGAYQGVVCLTNSENGPGIFRQLAEPIVGNITAIATWLRGRESLNISAESYVTSISNHAECTQSMREQLQAIKSEDVTDATTEDIQKPGPQKMS
ncbi:MAG: serine hydrolase [Legionellaceae bacterium]|nr:serine hydrolase [Legionellaceae bacterium]